MILFGSVEFLGGKNLGHDLPVQDFLLPLLRSNCCFLLFRGIEKTSSRVSKLHSFGSYCTRTTSEWFVVPEHTSSYVGSCRRPWVYPTSVRVTPGTLWKANSTPQKQPAPNWANCWPGAGMSSSGPWAMAEEEDESTDGSVGERAPNPSRLSQLILGVEGLKVRVRGELKQLGRGSLGIERGDLKREEQREGVAMVVAALLRSIFFFLSSRRGLLAGFQFSIFLD
ncbi:white collar-1 transcript variant 2 [Striga asiatica]|uniref:White collar-1 transcript variant 2 n=1 Tax=Striga asiatica TaxID=4170 RepID=A0A5A7QN25_STRAF|nr:white collar-1 transcript variant 2 [Striga asiatica]